MYLTPMIYSSAAESSPGVTLVGTDCVYQSDPNQNKSNPLEVTPITLYNTEAGYNLGKLIAVNNKYICYGIRGGMIRAINQTSVLRCLLRGHPEPITDLTFYNNEMDQLASCGPERVFIWTLSEQSDEKGEECIGSEEVSETCGGGQVRVIGSVVELHPCAGG